MGSATVCIMLVLPPSPIRSMLSGLGCVALLWGASEAVRMGPAVWLPYGVLTVALGAVWRRRTVAASASRPRGSLGGAKLARIAHEQARSTPRACAPGQLVALPSQRTFWSRVKLWVGGVGFVASGLWWLLLGALLITPDPAPALDGLFTSNFLSLVTISLLLTLLFVVILRSGLRGPADPLAPDQRAPTRLRDQPTPPGPLQRGPARATGKKSHLRLVRDTP
ncbi:hypothetical protein [Melittangium boletus]|uniref:Uncharacterized protein n=1 Tax=Melittangium boletus DSM 14713 TaxID=1294270 RepID=A0A250IQM1_9BACT|nr:hypothetical protein [Melittangium boletus]ATB33553.1 hypothetical protein MEBOL_007051 [Melittangium boletus DSM 14713]